MEEVNQPAGTPPPSEPDDAPIPTMQRLFDNPWLLLLAGMIVMFVFFTGWGVLEIMSLEPAPLP